MSILEKLKTIQVKLIAPKNQFNKFGNYHYRSCEDILEGLKPLLKETNSCLTINDEIIQIGERYYIKSTATLRDCEGKEEISNTAYAREEQEKKGMDGSQVTGSSSSYARKYALNGLFSIDDTKDSDSNEMKQEIDEKNKNNSSSQKKKEYSNTNVKKAPLTRDELVSYYNLGVEYADICNKHLKKRKYQELTNEELLALKNEIETKISKEMVGDPDENN